jgi:hypothetical protein
VVLAGLAAVVAAADIVLWAPQSRVTLENFDRIRVGITRAEVEAGLGLPGDHTTGPTRPTGRGYGVDLGLVCASVSHWVTDDGSIVVEFDAKGRVCGCAWKPTERVKQGPLENLLWRDKRQWHRWFP